jgi:hypothetical protein
MARTTDQIQLTPASAGVKYAITEVSGHLAADVSECIGHISFVVQIDGQNREISGSGVASEVGVRFYQEYLNHQSKDIRVWDICAVPGGGFTAEHSAAHHQQTTTATA